VEQQVGCWIFVFQLKDGLEQSIQHQSPRNPHTRVVRSSFEAWSVHLEYGHLRQAFG